MNSLRAFLQTTLAKRLILLLKIAVSATLLAYLFRRIRIDLLKPLLSLLPLLLIVGTAIGLSGLALMASRWKQLIQIATGKMIPFRDLFSYVMVGALYNNLLPGAIGGDIVRAQALSRQHDISLKTSAKISIVERAIGLSGVLFLICATAPFANIPYLINPTIVHFLSPLTMIFLGGICYKLCKSLSSSTMTWKKMVSISALLLLAQMSDILILHFFLYVQEVSLDPINLIFCVTLAYIAAALPISLGGLGVREGVLISMFALNGVAVPVATLASMLLLCTRLMTSGLGAIVHIRKSI